MKIIEIIDENLRGERKAEIRPTKWRVSGMGTCIRQRYLERVGAPCQPFEPRVLRVFKIGKILHEYIQELLGYNNLLVAKEGTVENDHIRGHFDAIVKDGDNQILYEFKSVHSRKFHYVRKRGGMDKHHIKQVLTYFMLLKPKYPKLKEARIVYFSKDDLCIEEQMFYLTPEREAEIKDELATLDKYWEEKKLPPAEPMEEWECGYCGFTQCPNNKNKLKNYATKSQTKNSKR